MRTLPDSASVEYLRRQAKDLLDLLRRSDPSTTLSDAQANLAQQYGYATWPELKHASEEQSAKPRVVADAAVVDELVRSFNLGAAQGDMVRLERIWAGQVWELEAPAGRVVLTELHDAVTPDAIEVEAGLVEQAIARGVSAPAPIRTAAGSVVTNVGGTNWRAHRWLRLGPLTLLPAPVEVAARAGETLAILHSMALPAAAPVVPWLSQPLSEGPLRGLAEQVDRDRPEWSAAFHEAVDDFLACDALLDTRDPNERAILSHACLAPHVVRDGGTHGIVVCGWEHASAVPPDWELGSCLMAWAESGDGGYVAEPARAFLDAYRQASGFEGPVTTGMLTGGLNGGSKWTVSRVNIALNDNDPVERELAERAVPGLIAANPISPKKITAFLESIA